MSERGQSVSGAANQCCRCKESFKWDEKLTNGNYISYKV